MRLARRVGPNGVVYAQDVQQQMLEAIARRVSARGLRQRPTPRSARAAIRTCRRGALDAVLIVDAYHEVDDDRVAFLRNLAQRSSPAGASASSNFKPGRRRPGAADQRARRERACRGRGGASAGLRLHAVGETLPLSSTC